MGIIDPFEANDREREYRQIEKDWNKGERDQLLIGADKDHPEGIYAKSGNDMMCMTEEEFRHWYGGCSHSGRHEAGK